MPPAWTILIATQGRRSQQLAGLLAVLLPQVEAAAGAVTVEALWNNGERPIGCVRQDLLEHATADYVCFADDDDMVAATYVSSILPLLGEVDYIGFNVMTEGSYCTLARHSLRYPFWAEEPEGSYRHVTHLNPLRRELALRGSFTGGHEGFGEDRGWAHQVRPHVTSEHYLDQAMYFYYPAEEMTRENPRVEPGEGFQRLQVDSACFSWHPASSP